MYVRAVVQEGVVEHAILVPQQGVSRDPKGNAVALIVDSSGKVAQRILTVDRAVGDKWLVSSGLAPGDRVIVEGAQKVRPGAPVKVVPFDEGRKDAPAGKGASAGGA
jgi:membrane fusion protein (multidrug efflux system)